MRERAGYGRGYHHLEDDFGEYVALEFFAPIPELHQLLTLDTFWAAEHWLRSLAAKLHNLQVLRALVDKRDHPFGPITTDEIVRRVARWIKQGDLRVARVPTRTWAYLVRTEEKEAEALESTPELLGLLLRVIDDITETPVKGLQLMIRLSDGSERKATTDSDGRVEISQLAGEHVRVTTEVDGATLAETVTFVKEGVVTSDEKAAKSGKRRKGASGKFLARLATHRVADGETLESVAQQYDQTADQLTRFNFGTTNPKKIQTHLFIDVGCTARDDSGQFLLTSDAIPGILYVPRPLELDRVQLGTSHILRVKKLPEPPRFIFSA